MSMSPPPAYGPPSPYASSDQPVQAPPRTRGTKRIVFGILGIVANAIGLVVMPIVAFFAVAVFAIIGASPTVIGGSGGSMEAASMSLYYVYVPADSASTASCAVQGSEPIDFASESSGLGSTIDGQEYTTVGTFQVSSDQTVEVQCEGAGSVAVADVGMVGTLIGAVVGIAIPIILGIIAIILLIAGIVARVRSSREQRAHAQSQYPGSPQQF